MKEKPVAVLTHHVLPGRSPSKIRGSVNKGARPSSRRSKAKSSRSSQGPGADHPRPKGNASKAVECLQPNGVIHVIDNVLMPS